MLTVEQFVNNLINTFFNLPVPQPQHATSPEATSEQFQQRTNAYKQQLAQNLSQLINHQIESVVNQKIQELVNANSGLVMPSYPVPTTLPSNE